MEREKSQICMKGSIKRLSLVAGVGEKILIEGDKMNCAKILVYAEKYFLIKIFTD